MTNIQVVIHESWLVRYSPHAPGFSRSNIQLKKLIPENENPDKVTDIFEEILNFNKQQKGKGHPSELAVLLKLLASK